MKFLKLVFTIIGVDILLLLVLRILKENNKYEDIDEDEYENKTISEILDCY